MNNLTINVNVNTYTGNYCDGRLNGFSVKLDTFTSEDLSS